jgi:N-acylneuraminate cytidylyltransferase
MRTAAIIPARGGSKRVPRKNLALVGGRALVEHAIDAADCLDAVWVSTEDAEIAHVAEAVGALVRRRPDRLARDESSTEDVITDWLGHLAGRDELPDVVVLLQPTSPLRTVEHVADAVQLLARTGADSLCSVTVDHAHHFAGRLIPHVDGAPRWRPDRPWAHRPRTQTVAPIAHENGAIWCFTLAHFRETGRRDGGRCVAYPMPKTASIDIDDADDLALANAMWSAVHGRS